MDSSDTALIGSTDTRRIPLADLARNPGLAGDALLRVLPKDVETRVVVAAFNSSI
jgi:hypothetical protein